MVTKFRMEKYIIMDTIIGAFTAIGTVAVAVVAIWGNWIRSKLAPPKLVIEPHNLGGNLTTFTNGKKVFCYHVVIRNKRTWSTSKNCRVLLKQILRRGPDNKFHIIPMVVPLQFVWAPADLTPSIVTINNEQILDLGYIEEGTKFFKPALYSYSNNFKGFVRKNEAVRYCLEIGSDNFYSEELKTFEVAWNGKWSDNSEEMAENLKITEIN